MPKILEFDDTEGSDYKALMYQKVPRINAGDAASVLEESPFESAYQLWGRKTGRIPRKEQTAAMRGGIATQPAIHEWYVAQKGVQGGAEAWAVSDEADWLQGKADFWNGERRLLAEFKAPQRDDSGDHLLAKLGILPYHYKLQCLHLFEVFDAAEMDFVSWRSPDDAVILPVKRDSEFWYTVMLPAYQQFIERVQQNAWPKPEGQVFIEDEDWARWARRLLDGKQMKREAEDYIKRAEAALKRMADNGAKVSTGAGIQATWTTYKARYEVVISAADEASRDKILGAVKPLEGKAGVGKISQRNYPPDLRLRITALGETEGNE